MRSGDFDTVLGGAEIFFGEEAEGLKTGDLLRGGSRGLENQRTRGYGRGHRIDLEAGIGKDAWYGARELTWRKREYGGD